MVEKYFKVLYKRRIFISLSLKIMLLSDRTQTTHLIKNWYNGKIAVNLREKTINWLKMSWDCGNFSFNSFVAHCLY